MLKSKHCFDLVTTLIRLTVVDEILSNGCELSIVSVAAVDYTPVTGVIQEGQKVVCACMVLWMQSACPRLLLLSDSVQ